MQKFAVLIGAVLAGNYLAERFILRPPGETGGLIDVSPGFGMDDIARAAIVAGIAIGGAHLLKKAGV